MRNENKHCLRAMMSKVLSGMAAICLLFAIPFSNYGQYTVVDDQFYSNALDADHMVDVWLPPGYFDNPRLNYPVVYLLHSAVNHLGQVNNHNGYEDFLPILNQMTADGEIDPFIIVKPNGWAPPYAGSCWYNSALYGNFEDMVRIDLINYIESNYRVLKGQDYRYIMGHSMGGHAAWSMTIRFPELFGAVADIAGYKHMGLTTQLLLPGFLAESGGVPPYNYSPANGPLSALVFTVLGAYNANMANPPFFVNIFLDADGNIIPGYYDDWLQDDIYLMIPSATQPQNTQYWIAQSTTDMVVPYPTIVQFMNRLDEYDWDYTFFPFDGGHFLIHPALEEGFRFIDGVWKTKDAPMDYSILIEDIEFQPGVTIDINVNVYVNENAVNYADHGKIIAVEGMAHTANCWKPLAEELFLSGPQGAHLNEFYAIDMPGRGGSGFPQGWNYVSNDVFKLADMYLEDYLAVIEGVISYINDEMGVYPKTIMGHSLGGLEVILLQDMLIAQGTNLRQKYQIKNAILLAPAMPAPLPWAFLGGGAAQLIPMAVDDPDHGWILNIPFYVWPYIFFTNTCCYSAPYMVPGAPTPAEVLTNGYNSIEAGPLLFHMAGLPLSILDPNTHHPTRPRMSANANIFKPQHGVQLTIFSEEFDKMMSPEEEQALYIYLTGDTRLSNFLLVEGEETCHDTHISDPHALVALLNNPNFFKMGEADAPEASAQISIYPNPAGPRVNIGYSLENDGPVSISLFDSRGSACITLDENFQASGQHTLALDISHLPAGVYFLLMKTGNMNKTVKVVKM
ncbi:MAG: alpha/beta fold hydrolase [Bacteroidales bacterium]|nr:alpha/beta fold hydrolase [Bacteroidales bacterium]